MTEKTATKPNAKSRAALGRGLGALLGDAKREEPIARRSPRANGEAAPEEGLALIAVSAIEPHPENPRVHFEEGALEDLAKSIAARGVIQPIIVRPAKGGTYQLVAGERRWRAAQKAQVHEIPAIIRKLDDRDVTALALIENIQREDLNPIEEARAYQRLSTRDSMSQSDIAELVEKSRSHVANLMRLLALPDPVLALVEKGELSMGHARALINCDNAEAIARDTVKNGLSVREVEKRVRKASGQGAAPRRAARPPREDNADIAAVQKHLEEFLGLPVEIKADADPTTGSVIVRYKSLDQLDLVCQRLSGGEI
ncbi:ParB/RepB/Spo0J family partition protein [Croceicoccus naphthovorans]|uniref:Chromosome partitioning protein ParB n=1 Tax=Croceicoccus naphthovorans TaxID=1348774 RepID=A0A0G3XKS4_9SPHN|nr:ParB/RepB/Spo0J family partition protein [Croceicoccus naphthovorans]AKM11196.1 chromosome partitioning protein ParB [Croceicoccus naphthovorans]MBB3989911.1 ParB family chromosome partitioning protein [Croceicoccus naphthovorans]